MTIPVSLTVVGLAKDGERHAPASGAVALERLGRPARGHGLRWVPGLAGIREAGSTLGVGAMTIEAAAARSAEGVAVAADLQGSAG